MVPYVDNVVAVTVMHVLLYVLHVCMLSEWMRGLDLGFANPVGTGRVLDVCVCLGCGGVGGVGG